jgi:serine/threonine-protein kinase
MATQQIDEKAIFNAARQIADSAARDEYLAQACGDDIPAIQRIRDLLRIHEQERSFLESPPAGLESNAAVPLMIEQPGAVIGPYKLLQQIGEGGFGVVFLAEQERPVKRRVALKIIKPGMDTRQVIARFEAERQALAMMDHPNIAKVHDAGTTGAGSTEQGARTKSYSLLPAPSSPLSPADPTSSWSWSRAFRSPSTATSAISRHPSGWSFL